MPTRRFILVLAFLTATGPPVMADLAIPAATGTPDSFLVVGGSGPRTVVRSLDPFIAAASADLLSSDLARPIRQLEMVGPLDALLGSGLLRLPQPGQQTQEPGSQEPGSTVRTLPPAPDGASLVLSGLMTLGAVHLARNARNVHLALSLHSAVVPDWYHADAVQVGGSVPYSLEQPPQPAYVIAALLARLAEHSRGPADNRFLSAPADTPQCILMTAAPRGPPALSF